SNDGKFVAQIDAMTGSIGWRHNLSVPVAAAPFFAGGRLLVPLVTGRIDVIDPSDGRLDGSFALDQPLSAAGTLIPRTPLVPGAANCVYVVDLVSKSCIAVLETDHAAGALVAPPIMLPAGDERAWIVLTQAERGPQVRLRLIPFSTSRPWTQAEKDVVLSGT